MAVEYNTKVFVFMNNFNVSIGSWKVQRLSRRRWADEHCFGLRDVGPQLPSFHPCYGGGVNAGLHGGNEVGRRAVRAQQCSVISKKADVWNKRGQIVHIS